MPLILLLLVCIDAILFFCSVCNVYKTITGRPNVGKSSLFNHYYGSARSIVSDIAGTTRDAVDALIVRRNSTYRIIDTGNFTLIYSKGLNTNKRLKLLI